MQTKLNLWYGSWTCRGYFMTWLWVSRKSASLKERNSLFKCFLSDISKTGFCLMPCQFYRNLGQGCGSVSWASGLHILVLLIQLPSSPGVNFQCSCCAQSYALMSLCMLKIPGIDCHWFSLFAIWTQEKHSKYQVNCWRWNVAAQVTGQLKMVT